MNKKEGAWWKYFSIFNWKNSISILEKFYISTHFFYISEGPIQLLEQLFLIPYRKKDNCLPKEDGLHNHNIWFHNHILNDPIGTSQGFFPSITDYFPVPNSTAVKLATRTQRNHANIGKLSSICRLINALQKSQRTKSVFFSISAGSTVLTNHQFSTCRLSELGWSHYRALMGVENRNERLF